VHLGHVVGDLLDVVDPGAPGEAQFGERLDRLAEVGVVDERRVTTDDAGRLQAVDAPFDRRGREPDLLPDGALGTAGVLLQEPDDLPVNGVYIAESPCHRNNLSSTT